MVTPAWPLITNNSKRKETRHPLAKKMVDTMKTKGIARFEFKGINPAGKYSTVVIPAKAGHEVKL